MYLSFREPCAKITLELSLCFMAALQLVKHGRLWKYTLKGNHLTWCTILGEIYTSDLSFFLSAVNLLNCVKHV